MLAEILKTLRNSRKFTQQYVADYLGVTRQAYAKYENGHSQPDTDSLAKLAKLYDVSIDYLVTGKEQTNGDSKHPELTEKDEKDIAKRMDQIRKDVTNEDGLLFNGEPMSEEAIESFLEAMEHAVRQTQRINKKYIPKKYREENNED